ELQEREVAQRVAQPLRRPVRAGELDRALEVAPGDAEPAPVALGDAEAVGLATLSCPVVPLDRRREAALEDLHRAVVVTVLVQEDAEPVPRRLRGGVLPAAGGLAGPGQPVDAL